MKLIDAVYTERDTVVALAATLAQGAGLRTWIGPASDAEPGWSSVVYIELPTGQVSWHVKDEELPLFRALPSRDLPWDGHDTPAKYARIVEYLVALAVRKEAQP